MKEDKPKTEKRTDIRKQAEEVIKGKTTDLKKLSPGDIQGLVHELQVHQVELEMQNEELRRAQKELEDTRNRYCDLYDFAPIGYFTFDKNGLILEVNLTGAKKLGRERAYLIKKPFYLYIHGNKDAFYLHLREVFNTEKQMTCEFRLVDSKGNIFDALLESMPVHDRDGNLLARTAISDITQVKQAEEERIQILAREKAALAEAQAARKLDRLKSMFIASTSHELRTPLNSIIGFSSMLLDGYSGELNPEQRFELDIVHSAGKHLLSLISDIIDSSKIEAGKIDLQVSEVELSQVVDEAVSIMGASLKEKGLGLSVEVEKLTLKTDKRRLLQCIINIISNAVKYTEKGSIKITAKTIGNNVDISVTDTGIGIKNEDIPKLFAPFVRLETPLTEKTPGTGLGLYVVKKLAKDYLGGDLEVESEFGTGSKFTLNIPIELENTAMRTNPQD